MPKTSFDKPRYPPVNWMLAAVLERKHVMGLRWEDLAVVAGVSDRTMRRLGARVPPEEWPSNVRKAVLRKLGITVKMAVSDAEHEIEVG